MDSAHPKLFVSYCWSSEDHKQWVIQLCSELRGDGVDVLLDVWDLKEGNDKYAYMERMVTDASISKVILISDRLYAEKADGREGGVGTETQIVSKEMYEGQDQSKFVAVLPERDTNGFPYLPTYYSARIYIDLSHPGPTYAEEYERLVRWIYDKPLHVKPPIGEAPRFLSDDSDERTGTEGSNRRAIDALRKGHVHAIEYTREYFARVTASLQTRKLTRKPDVEFDDLVFDDIESMLPLRNQVLDAISALVRYQPEDHASLALHGFIESMLPLMEPTADARSWDHSDFDNHRFFIHEIFLHTTALLLSASVFDGLAALLTSRFYAPTVSGDATRPTVGFGEIVQPTPSLDRRNARLKLQRMSLRADLLVDRTSSSDSSVDDLLQADFALFLRATFDRLRGDKTADWFPVSLVYASRKYGPFEAFARCESASFFSRFKQVVGIDTKDEMVAFVTDITNERALVPRFGLRALNVAGLSGVENICAWP